MAVRSLLALALVAVAVAGAGLAVVAPRWERRRLWRRLDPYTLDGVVGVVGSGGPAADVVRS
jgi:hypothetical protein